MSQVLGAENYKGYYATASALITEIPTGSEGWWAIVQASNSIYIWNVSEEEWVSTGGGGGGGTPLGDWDPSTNTPTLPNPPTAPTYQVGDYYVSIGTGTFAGLNFTPNDKIVVAPDGSDLQWNKETGGAVDSVFGRVGAVVAVSGDYNASQITNTPSGGISAITVQAALNELDTEKASLNADVSFSNITLSNGGAIKSSTTLGNTVIFASVYDTDDAVYRSFITGTVGTTPTLAIGAPAGGTLTITGAASIQGTDLNGTNLTSSFANIGFLRTAQVAGELVNFQAYYTGGTPAFETLMSLQAGTTPTLAIAASTHGAVTINGASIGNVTPGSGAFTTLTAATATLNDATTPSLTTASGKTNTGYFQVNGKTSGALKITAADATAQTITLTTAAQTSGAATLTIPDMAGVSKTIAWLESPVFTTAVTTSSPSFDVFNTTATTLNFAGAATTGTFGYNSTASSTTNISTGATGSGNTKTLNLGTGGASGSTTNVNIGSSNGGTTTINSATLVGAATTQAVFNTVATTINAFSAATAINMGANTATFTYAGRNITFNNATSSVIIMGSAGGGAPTLTTRSNGTKFVAFPAVSGSSVDFAIGIETDAMWYSGGTSTSAHKWYAGTTNIATLSGVGNYTLAGDLAVNGGDITTNQTTFNLLNTTVTTGNLFGAATTVNLGANGSVINLNSGTSADYRRVVFGGGNSYGYIFTSFAGLGDGINLSYNRYYDAAGTQTSTNTGSTSSIINIGYASVSVKVAATNNGTPANVAVFSSGQTEFFGTNPIRIAGVTSGTGTAAIIDSNGDILKLTSSIRFKENVIDSSLNSSLIYQLRPVEYDYKKSGQHDFGLIAEEVEKLYPLLINYDKQGRAESIKYDRLSVLLISEMKQLKKQIELLTN